MTDNRLVKKKESSVEFFIYAQDSNKVPSKAMNVFYNEKMILNRDLTNLAIDAYKKLYNVNNFDFIDSMAASGITSLRIMKEFEDLHKIYINDTNPLAVDLIKKNLKLNKLDSSKVVLTSKDANCLFSDFSISNDTHSVDIISVDPFGTPNKFIDMAFKAIRKKHGLLCITATDTAVLFGVKPNVCIRKYMVKPLHTEYCKEIGARILVHFISRIANINNLGIIPLLSFYSNHFLRIFVLTIKKKKDIIHNFSNYGYLLHCKVCGYRTQSSYNVVQIPQFCPVCNKSETFNYSGPLWIGELHQESFLKQIISMNKEMNYSNEKIIDKKIKFALDEINMPPFYYDIHKLCQELKLPSIPKLNDIIESIKSKGFNASRTHFDYLAIKTNLTISELKKILLSLIKKNYSGIYDG